MVIGYYVHHHGVGHLTRARVIAESLRTRGHQVTLFGSELGDTPGITLPRDNDGFSPFEDADANQALHWAPMDHPGYSARMGAIASWALTHRPAIFVVDVSVEVVTCLRLLGVRTVVVAQPGDRSDAAHTLAFRCATAILAPWPPEAEPCPALRPFDAKTFHTGGISGIRQLPQERELGVVLSGQGGAANERIINQLQEQLPQMNWINVGANHWVDDIAALLARTQVVVTHCGQNAIADIATLDIPAVLCPQDRPHDEQRFLANELSILDIATSISAQDLSRFDWATAVTTAIQRPTQWARWGTSGSAERAADAIERVSTRPSHVVRESVHG